MLSVHVMTNVPPLARSYQDGGCRIAERVGIRTIRNRQTNKKQIRNKQTKQDKADKEQSNQKKKQDKTRQEKIN